jgi:hypothetical protein
LVEDLDGLLAYKPWLDGNGQAYESAVAAGVVPPPVGFGPGEMQEHFDAISKDQPAEDGMNLIHHRTSYWNEAHRRLMPFRGTLPDGESNQGPFQACLKERVLKFWGLEPEPSEVTTDEAGDKTADSNGAPEETDSGHQWTDRATSDKRESP